MIGVELSGPELATYLSVHLTDLEFELLVRKRIEHEFTIAMMCYKQFENNHSECSYTHSFNDKSEWRVQLGSTYRDSTSLRGEVLGITVRNTVTQYRVQNENKLSKLLPAPVTDDERDIEL